MSCEHAVRMRALLRTDRDPASCDHTHSPVHGMSGPTNRARASRAGALAHTSGVHAKVSCNGGRGVCEGQGCRNMPEDQTRCHPNVSTPHMCWHCSKRSTFPRTVLAHTPDRSAPGPAGRVRPTRAGGTCALASGCSRSVDAGLCTNSLGAGMGEGKIQRPPFTHRMGSPPAGLGRSGGGWVGLRAFH